MAAPPQLASSTNNLAGVSYLVGHKHPATTAKYVHANRQHAEQVLAAVSAREQAGADGFPVGVDGLPGGVDGFPATAPDALPATGIDGSPATRAEGSLAGTESPAGGAGQLPADEPEQLPAAVGAEFLIHSCDLVGPGPGEAVTDAPETQIISTKCTRRDLNSHALRRRNLNPVRLPIPPLVRTPQC
jgi:hypothetical protein